MCIKNRYPEPNLQTKSGVSTLITYHWWHCLHKPWDAQRPSPEPGPNLKTKSGVSTILSPEYIMYNLPLMALPPQDIGCPNAWPETRFSTGQICKLNMVSVLYYNLPLTALPPQAMGCPKAWPETRFSTSAGKAATGQETFASRLYFWLGLEGSPA